MFYFKAKRISPIILSNQDTNINLTEEDRVQNDMYDKENWHNKLGLPQKIDINISHCYSNIREKLLCLTYDNLGVQLTGTLEVCDGCTFSEVKLCAVRKKNYTWATNPGDFFC